VVGPILYSTQPWFAAEIATKYRGGVHFAWVSECFDISSAPAGSAAALIAPTSSPRRIYRDLQEACTAEDSHNAAIVRYKKTFQRLAREWLGDGSLTKDQGDEIIASVRAPSWRIWRPVLYVIPSDPVVAAGRLISVPRRDRAAYGPELQINDLRRHEFDIIELVL
jgi:hypothetical protein